MGEMSNLKVLEIFIPIMPETLALESVPLGWAFCLQDLFFFFLIGILLIYNVILVSGVQQNDSIIHIHIYLFFFKLFSRLGYYRVLSRVPCYTVGYC